MISKISLNPQQLKAVRHKKGPLLIIAGAGTGKTTVITEKIKYLIDKQDLSPNKILALTFTDKAAREMLERLDLVMPLGYQEPWLSTFHSFCDRILKAEGLSIGLDPGYKIIPTAQQWILINKHLFDFKLEYFRPLGNPTKFIAALITFFSRAQDEDVDPETLLKFAQQQKAKAQTETDSEEADKLLEVARAFHTYQALKLKQSVLDFGDLITQTLKLFRNRKSILKKYQQQFDHILVDEFQDTNYAQYQLIKLLAPAKSNPNLVVVGDDDQSVFKFRGASLSNILDFKNDYPKAHEIVLTQNYRSIKPILDTAYKVIQNNNPDRLEVKLKVIKQLTPTNFKKPKEKPQINSFPTQEEETEWVSRKILELSARENYTYKDFAILARANSQLAPFVATFRRHGLPYQLVGNRGLFDQEEIRQLQAFLKVVVNPHDSISLFQFLHNEIFSFKASQILTLIQQAKTKRVSLFKILKDETKKNCRQVTDLIESAQQIAVKQPPTKLLYNFFKTTNYIKLFTQQDSIENQLKVKNINLFLRLIKAFEADSASLNTNVVELVEFLDLLAAAGENPAQAEIEDIDTIRLITVHSAKGLEFPVVFIPSLVTGRFPAVNRRDPIDFPEALIKETLPEGDENIQEERRLFYVGLTRAKDYLYLTWAKDYGGVRQRHPSGFLDETNLKQHQLAAHGQLSLLDIAKNKQPQVSRVKAGKVQLKYVSYSQIDTFKTCPLKYKYRYILQVPAEPHHALSFGQSIHDTLRHFHTFQQKGQKLKLKDLLYLYKRYFRQEGYESEKHKQARFKAGEQALKKYFKTYQQKLGKPIYLEKSFRLNLNGIPLYGKIDRIDQKNGHYEIIDYKTGQSQEKKQVDKDEQLSIYAVGAKYALNIKPEKLSLYFLEKNQKVSTTRSDEEIETTLARLKTRVKEMQQSDFSAKPGYPFPCQYCEYNRICPFAAKKK